MTTRFVRSSKYRHVYGTPNKREQCIENVKASRSAWDTNVVKVNPLFVSVNWEASGGGAFAVIPQSFVGKLPETYPLCAAHTAAVVDTDWNPFNDHVVASGSEDCTVMVWKIPEGGPTETITAPAMVLAGHQRKIGHVLFHPTADNVLASTSCDQTIRFWDIAKGSVRVVIDQHPDIINSISFSYDGTLLASTCKDKKLRVSDVRSGQVIAEATAHVGIKGSRVCWLGDSDFIATTGFTRTSERQVFVWDARNLASPIIQESIDQSSGMLMPFYDDSTKMLYLAGKGDGNIRYYEFAESEVKLHYLTEYKSNTPQRGMGFLPKRGVNVSETEIARMYKCLDNTIEPISFRVPRKSDLFQADIFVPCPGDQPALTSDEFFDGQTAKPTLISLENGFVPTVRDFTTPLGTSPASSGPSSPIKISVDYSSRAGGRRSRSGTGVSFQSSHLSEVHFPASEAPATSNVATNTNDTGLSITPTEPRSRSNSVRVRAISASTEEFITYLRKENDELKKTIVDKDQKIKMLEEMLARVMREAEVDLEHD